MAKLSKYFIVLVAIFTILGIESCKNENETPSFDKPVIQAPTGTSVLVGKVVSMDFQVNVPGKISTVTATATDGSVALVSTPIVGQTSGTVTVEYTAPLTEGTQQVTITVEDQQDPPKSASAVADVAVTLAPESTTELLVAQFPSAPTLDGDIDDVWNLSQKLVGTVEVPSGLGKRNTYYNEPGIGEENLDIFEAYEGEKYPFTMRAGYTGGDIYFLIEWEDAVDSKDRQSWYFDSNSKKWKQEHKYANDANDKYYEDKFSFLFPIGTVDGFESTTCYATCHSSGGVINKEKDKHTRHYLKDTNQKIDMWHWKRVRGAYAGQADDQRIIGLDPPYTSSSNGRGGDADGSSGYSSNSQTLNNGNGDVKVPLYVIPDKTDYYWITQDEIDGGTAKKVVGVDQNGVLTLDDNSTIDPNGDSGYDQGTGNKRFPSVTIKAFTGGRGDIEVKAVHTGTGWIAEVKRKMDTNDVDDVIFDPATDLPFGFAIFNNAAIAHAIKPGLIMKFEQ